MITLIVFIVLALKTVHERSRINYIKIKIISENIDLNILMKKDEDNEAEDEIADFAFISLLK